jgi:hypothetical protein
MLYLMVSDHLEFDILLEYEMNRTFLCSLRVATRLGPPAAGRHDRSWGKRYI